MKSTTMTLIALLALPVAGAAQGSSTGTEASAQGRAQAEASGQTPEGRIRAALAAAAEARIPGSLLESKVAEGRAKQVPEARIATAIEARLEALVRASAALEQAGTDAVSAADLAVSADALEAGISHSLLVRVARGTEDNRRVVAIAVLADLVRLGHGPENALARVTAAASSNAALANLNAEVAGQLRRGGLVPTLDGIGAGAGLGIGRRP